MHLRCAKIGFYKTMFMFIGGLLFLTYWSIIGVVSFNNINFPNADFTDRAAVHETTYEICNFSYYDKRLHLKKGELPTIYYVTPTYPRPEQLPELTRLSHTLMHIPRIHWIVADDQRQCSDEVLSVLVLSGIPYTHLASPKPDIFHGSNVPRGVANRRAALSWLRKNKKEGILYFGDDDNTVDLRLFDEIRKTKKVSMFPVGLIGGYGVSAPVVRDGKIVGFFDPWPATRTYPVDMAGFAVNLQHLPPEADMPFVVGFEEDRFLLSLSITLDEIEPLADNCSKILVWHTRTVKFKKANLRIDVDNLKQNKKYVNFVQLLNNTQRMGMANLNPMRGRRMVISLNKKSYTSLNSLT